MARQKPKQNNKAKFFLTKRADKGLGADCQKQTRKDKSILLNHFSKRRTITRHRKLQVFFLKKNTINEIKQTFTAKVDLSEAEGGIMRFLSLLQSFN